jgi:LmbE family N-acetylglucosaminyl deacetylase
MRVLHVAPHPDDELLGSAAVLMSLAGAGHEITNLAASLGRPHERSFREAELREACDRAGFALRICSPPHDLGLDDDRAAARARLTGELTSLIDDEGFELLIAPSPHDGHHGHEVVGRAATTAAEATGRPLWMWGLWSELPLPTILHPFDWPLLRRILDALEAHASQLARNDFRTILRARAELTAGVGPERVFGFGSPGIDAPCAEVLCEAVPAARGRFLLGTPRVLDPEEPLAAPTDADLRGWLTGPSPREQISR